MHDCAYSRGALIGRAVAQFCSPFLTESKVMSRFTQKLWPQHRACDDLCMHGDAKTSFNTSWRCKLSQPSCCYPPDIFWNTELIKEPSDLSTGSNDLPSNQVRLDLGIISDHKLNHKAKFNQFRGSFKGSFFSDHREDPRAPGTVSSPRWSYGWPI